MDSVKIEIKNALEEIEKKIQEKRELSQKDLLTLLADSLINEECIS